MEVQSKYEQQSEWNQNGKKETKWFFFSHQRVELESVSCKHDVTYSALYVEPTIFLWSITNWPHTDTKWSHKEMQSV